MKRAIRSSALFFFLAPFASGCSEGLQSVTPTAQPPEARGSQPPPDERRLSPALIEILNLRDAEERALFHTDGLEVAGKKEKEQAQEKVAAAPKPPKAPEEPPTILQDTPGPVADNQLLELWQKDFEKAMEQPAERRKIEFSIPVVENDRVLFFVNFFTGRKRDFFERALARSGRYVPMMAAVLREKGLPEDLVYLSLIESGFSLHAYSKAHAVGPWQFIRSTGLRYGLRIDWWVDERRDPVKATHAAAAYLRDLHLLFGEWFLAAAAYNAGEGKVGKALNRSQTNDFWLLSQKNHLKRETRNYVPKFIAAALIAREPEKYGFEDIVYEAPLDYDVVTVKGPLRLQTAAQWANTTLETMKNLNPSLLRTYTPPQENGFLLRVPAGQGRAFAEAYELLSDSAEVKIVNHTVVKGETLQGIARRYRLNIKQLMEWNNLKSRRVRAGQTLVIILDKLSLKKSPPSPRR